MGWASAITCSASVHKPCEANSSTCQAYAVRRWCGLLTLLHEGKTVRTCFKRTPDFGHPVGRHRQVETTLGCLVEVTAGFCLCKHLLDELHSSTEILPAQRGEVARDHATRTRFQVWVSQFLR